jgi:predicted HicB family RNase H-like nuclease
MKNVMHFKGFIGSVYFSPDDDCFHGRIEGVDDLVTFEGSSVNELKISFKEAVEDYVELCRATGKLPQKSYTGNFNIRISSDLHKKAVRRSVNEGISLNQLVRRAIEKEIGKGP